MEDKCDLNLKLYYKFVNIHRMRKYTLNNQFNFNLNYNLTKDYILIKL